MPGPVESPKFIAEIVKQLNEIKKAEQEDKSVKMYDE